jgi:hypothetical protein
MSKRNRQRRQEKRRRQTRVATSARVRVGSASAAFRESAAADVSFGEARSLFVEAALSRGVRDDQMQLLLVAWLTNDIVPMAAAHCLEQAVAQAWSKGWQPSDIRRIVTRQFGAEHARLAVLIIAADAERYRDHQGADPAWLGQLDAMGARSWWSAHAPILCQWSVTESISPERVLLLALQLFALLYQLPRLHRVCTPPDEWGTSAIFTEVGQSIDPKILARVRALLAKAESTTFPEEAEALTAKAQELIARHAIEAAMLEGGDGQTPPGARRLGVDDPYAAAKALLLSKVAEASRCRAVWDSDLGFSTVFGFPAELDAVELLYTSLLVQATAAMVAEGKRPEQRRQRSRGFRQSFLVSFASRIGERLRDTTAAVVSEASAAHGGALLPVLASRSEAVSDACAAAFPNTSVSSPGASDAAGWVAGRTAADMASLAVGKALSDGGGP